MVAIAMSGKVGLCAYEVDDNDERRDGLKNMHVRIYLY